MHPHNSLLGQNQILAVHASGKRIWTPRSILGHLQHDWDLLSFCSADVSLNAGLTSFLWSAPGRARRARLGLHNHVVVGAPWLYLLDLDPELLEPEPALDLAVVPADPIETAPARADAVVFVEHGIEGGHLARRVAAAVRERESGEVTVALAAHDAAIPAVRTAYEGAGFEVHDLGPLQHVPGTDQPRYLDRLRGLMNRHQRLLSNTVRAEVLYAATLGLSATIIDPAPSHKPHRLDLLPGGATAGHPIADLNGFADEELGRRFVLPTDDLSDLFEWNSRG